MLDEVKVRFASNEDLGPAVLALLGVADDAVAGVVAIAAMEAGRRALGSIAGNPTELPVASVAVRCRDDVPARASSPPVRSKE